MAEYIKRDAVLQIISDAPRFYLNDMIRADAMRDYVKRLPAVDVRENVRGKWLTFYGDEIQLDSLGRTHTECYCSVCGDYLCASYEYACRGNFCPNCGADMR